MQQLKGRQFWKLTGSGNDFVFFDARRGSDPTLLRPDVIDAVCDRRSGVGADGIVLFEQPVEKTELYSIRYFNRDGTLAEMCGNASLCSISVAQLLKVVAPEQTQPFAFHTSSGMLLGKAGAGGEDPQIQMPPPRDLVSASEIERATGEQRIGFVRVGVPHLVLLVDDVANVDVEKRGRRLRMDQRLRDGANVNFISRTGPGSWRMRTYERGVEAETLACGSGAIAVAQLLGEWGLEPDAGEVSVRTSGGRALGVSWRMQDGARIPFLQGEGRLVFAGEIA